MRFIFYSVVLLPLIYVFFSFLYSMSTSNCTRSVTVVEIGGCNRDACGVRFSDETIDRMANPVLRENVCLEKEFKFKWLFL